MKVINSTAYNANDLIAFLNEARDYLITATEFYLSTRNSRSHTAKWREKVRKNVRGYNFSTLIIKPGRPGGKYGSLRTGAKDGVLTLALPPLELLQSSIYLLGGAAAADGLVTVPRHILAPILGVFPGQYSAYYTRDYYATLEDVSPQAGYYDLAAQIDAIKTPVRYEVGCGRLTKKQQLYNNALSKVAALESKREVALERIEKMRRKLAVEKIESDIAAAKKRLSTLSPD